MNITSREEPLLTLTPDAAGQVRHLIEIEPANKGKTLRLYVEKGGCSGLQYGMVFDAGRDGDHVVHCHGVDVLVDDFSTRYLRGVVVDFKDTLNDGGFKISNPNARESCGCGSSFGV